MAEAAASDRPLRPGDVVWARPEIAVGREQAGRRPAMIVAGASYLEAVDTLAVVVPITTVDRGWPNHVEVIGAKLGRRSWAMSDQIRTISRQRVVGRAGQVDQATLVAVREWIADFSTCSPRGAASRRPLRLAGLGPAAPGPTPGGAAAERPAG